jgi:hypothetical protein
MSADALEKLEEVLRLAGITNPQRALILKRWSQKVGKPLPEKILQEKPFEEIASDAVLEVYDKKTQSELQEL